MKTRQKPQGLRNDEHPPKKMKSLQEASKPIVEMGIKINNKILQIDKVVQMACHWQLFWEKK
jgi:hypothetical protein